MFNRSSAIRKKKIRINLICIDYTKIKKNHVSQSRDNIVDTKQTVHTLTSLLY